MSFSTSLIVASSSLRSLHSHRLLVEVLEGPTPLLRSCLIAVLSIALYVRGSSAGFITAPTYAVGSGPNSVAVADFNGDGIPDLAVGNFNDGTVSVLLGKGDGTFQTAQSFAAGMNPQSLAVGDFKGDGIPDLAVANTGSPNGTVNILLGKGDGSFQVPVGHDLDFGPRTVAVGDFNGDGKLDLVVAGDSGDYPGLIVLLGKGDGTFQTAQSIDAGPDLESLAVGDFNGDGHLDLVVTNILPDFTSTVGILLGKGDGTFESPQSYGPGSFFSSVAVGDFNGDGILDLAVGNFGSYDGLGNVSVLLGKGDGTFQYAQSYAAGLSPGLLAVADFNGDGRLDIVTDGSILLGNGDGTFQGPLTFAPGGSLAIGDFNRDGIRDLAVVNFGSNTVCILLGKGDGTFRGTPHYAAGPGAWFVAASDFNGDGHLDLATVNIGLSTVSILLGKADGTFQKAQDYAVGVNPESLGVGDFNGDGKLDLAVVSTNDSTIRILLGNGDGTFQDPKSYAAGSFPTFVAVGDFNRDGYLDLAVSNGPTVSILLGNGDGSFQNPQNYAADSMFIAVGDFNGDGKLDIATVGFDYANSMGNVTVLLGNGDGTFHDGPSYATGSLPTSVAVGDFNGDGNLDLALGGFVPGNPTGMVSILLGNGDGSFRAPVSYTADFLPVSMAVGDFNRDGHADLALNNYGGTVSILLGKGDGTFQDPQSYPAGLQSASVSMTVGDFNGDGFPDLAVADEAGVTVLLNAANWGGGPGNP